MTYRILADLVILLHAAFVAFIVIGLALILVGGYRGWAWVRFPSFRIAHLLAIGYVVVQEWLGFTCPLTTLESELRAKAGEATYAGGFVAHWLDRLVFYQAPPVVFLTVYTMFGLLVAAAWFAIRPRLFPGHNGD
ncbi:MAG TPA: DUF2784 domain-containing protein [Casimicrobiaceae bacterium]|nr:DUF2784 domain-containing protein [Casimicrobiaceae bacterium]